MQRRVYALEIYQYPTKKTEALDDLVELEKLVEAAGYELIESELYNIHDIHPHTCLGPGKLEQLKEHFIADLSSSIDLVIVDFPIKPYALKHIEDFFSIEVSDRTRLILEIFKRRATSAEGKLQVELAEAMYELGRLTGKGLGKELSRLGGGVGTRGPGEQKTEQSKRAYLRKIKTLREKLTVVEQSRHTHYNYRKNLGFKLVSLVGYTNAGKSTILNKLAKSEETVARDQLFTTVDPTTRKIYLNGHEILLTDTVGFIKKLPTELVEGFESTLEQVTMSDMVLMVVDRSDAHYKDKEEKVREILEKLRVTAPIVTVYNKIDALATTEKFYEYPDTVYISAIDGKGLDKLRDTIEKRLFIS